MMQKLASAFHPLQPTKYLSGFQSADVASLCRTMNDEPPLPRSVPDAEVEREVRQGRKFTAQEAIARMAGPGAMKDASPVSRERQAEVEIGSWLSKHVVDTAGALKGVLHGQLKGSELLLDNIDRPLVALRECCRLILASDELLKELVREADVEWGRLMDERPHFDREGFSPHPDDAYTVESVRRTLTEVFERTVPLHS